MAQRVKNKQTNKLSVSDTSVIYKGTAIIKVDKAVGISIAVVSHLLSLLQKVKEYELKKPIGSYIVNIAVIAIGSSISFGIALLTYNPPLKYTSNYNTILIVGFVSSSSVFLAFVIMGIIYYYCNKKISDSHLDEAITMLTDLKSRTELSNKESINE